MKINFFGTWIDQQSEESQVELVNLFIQSNRPHYITYPNVRVVVTANKDDELMHAINQADISSPDGKPLEFVARLKGLKEFKRCAGPDMMLVILKESESQGYTNYFYGSTQETLDKLKVNLLKSYPKLKILKMYSPPFRPLTVEEENNIINELNTITPDLIWIGLGAPKQEKLMYRFKCRLKRGVLLGVGAAFDFHANNIKRAPIWMQQLGLEWFYRLLKEPRRLFMQYLVTNSLFFLYLLKYGVKINE